MRMNKREREREREDHDQPSPHVNGVVRREMQTSHLLTFQEHHLDVTGVDLIDLAMYYVHLNSHLLRHPSIGEPPPMSNWTMTHSIIIMD